MLVPQVPVEGRGTEALEYLKRELTVGHKHRTLSRARGGREPPPQLRAACAPSSRSRGENRLMSEAGAMPGFTVSLPLSVIG